MSIYSVIFYFFLYLVEVTMTSNDFNGPIDVLLLPTDDIELGVAYKILHNPKIEDSGEHQGQLCFGEIGRNKVALLKSSETATGGSRAHEPLCAETINKLKPKAIVTLGVCSGTKEELHHLGDVLVSSQVAFHQQPSVNTEHRSTNSFGPTFDCNLGLAQLFAYGNFGWYGPFQEVLVPKVHFGQVIIGTQAVDNTTYKDELKQLYSEAIGIDMQGEGMLQNYNSIIWYYLNSHFSFAW